MKNFIASCGLRAARKPVALIIAVAALIAIPAQGFASPNNPAPAYKPGAPLDLNTPQIQAGAQPPAATETQAAAPADVMKQEMVSLNVRFGACQSAATCSPITRLVLLSDASNAMHESLKRISDECAARDKITCLAREYAALQQWSAINGQMQALLQSVAADAEQDRHAILMSQGAQPAGSALNNMEPAAGNPDPFAPSP